MATTEVNGKICLNPAYDVGEKDIVKYDGRRIDIINETMQKYKEGDLDDDK